VASFTLLLTHVLGVAYVASTPLGFVDVFRAMAGKVVLVLADAETGLDAEALDMLGGGETC
jgi:hypothetical protein